MELGEGIAVPSAAIGQEKHAPSCREQPHKDTYGWEARVNGLGQDTTKCSGTNLYNNMDARGTKEHEDKGLGYIPPKRSNDYWATHGYGVVSPTNFPLQAHHLIPKNFLPKHSVCVWLCKDAKSEKYELTEDAQYNTDHANNGYAMPDALRLKEWKSAKDSAAQTSVAFKVMELTGVQLHQGSHAETLDREKINKFLRAGKLLPIEPVAPGGDSDEASESGIHDPGYLNAIKEWLNAAGARIQDHVNRCDQGCKRAKSGKTTKVRPLKDTVRLMNQVSSITKAFLQMNAIYTCPYGAAYAIQKGDLIWDEAAGRFHLRAWE